MKFLSVFQSHVGVGSSHNHVPWFLNQYQSLSYWKPVLLTQRMHLGRESNPQPHWVPGFLNQYLLSFLKWLAYLYWHSIFETNNETPGWESKPQPLDLYLEQATESDLKQELIHYIEMYFWLPDNYTHFSDLYKTPFQQIHTSYFSH